MTLVQQFFQRYNARVSFAAPSFPSYASQSSHGRIAWLLPPASPVAPNLPHPIHTRYAISCTPIPSWSSSKCQEAILGLESTRCPRDGTPVLGSSVARSRRKSPLALFCSGRLLGCLEFKMDTKELSKERTTTSSLVVIQPFQPGRNTMHDVRIVLYFVRTLYL